MSTKTQQQQLDYDDALLDFYFACQQFGARAVLDDFKRQFPEMYGELLVQINRPHEKVAAIFLPRVPSCDDDGTYS